MADPQVLEGAEAFRFGSGPVGVLMIHGFTGSPQSLRPLGEDLASRGLTVEGIRLPGHGTTWRDCNVCTAADWRRAVDEGYAVLAAGCREVFLLGLSFGVSLAVDFIARRPEVDVRGLISLAGFLRSNDPRRFLVPLAARLVPAAPGVANDIADPEARELAYDRFPNRAGAQMFAVARAARAALPRVRCPVLVIHSRHDHTAPPLNADLIYSRVGSGDKEIVWLERSYHVITLDFDKDEVHRRTYEFIKERSDAL